MQELDVKRFYSALFSSHFNDTSGGWRVLPKTRGTEADEEHTHRPHLSPTIWVKTAPRRKTRTYARSNKLETRLPP